MSDRPLKKNLSQKEAADYYGVSEFTIRRWIAAGSLPAYRIGKSTIRIKADDLVALARRIPAVRRSS